MAQKKGAWYGEFLQAGEFRARREYTHTLRLESELSDLRVGYANSGNASDCVRGRIRTQTCASMQYGTEDTKAQVLTNFRKRKFAEFDSVQIANEQKETLHL